MGRPNPRKDYIAVRLSDGSSFYSPPSVAPGSQIWTAATYSAQQTGTSLWIPASGSSIAVTHVTLAAGGSTSGRVTLWFGAGGDTTYTEGTDQPLIDSQFRAADPGLTLGENVVFTPSIPVYGGTTKTLKVTTSTAVAITVVVYGYEFVR